MKDGRVADHVAHPGMHSRRIDAKGPHFEFDRATGGHRAGDGRFQLQGRGFLWQQNQKLLTISNDVRAVIQWTNNAPPSSSPRAGLNSTRRNSGEFSTMTCREDTNQCSPADGSPFMPARTRRFRTRSPPKRTNRNTFDLIEGRWRIGHHR